MTPNRRAPEPPAGREPAPPPEPAAPEGGEPPLLSNADLARIFHDIGDLLEIKGELVYKAVAYHRAADAIAHAPREIARALRAGERPRIPGVGTALAAKLSELARTGRLEAYERLRAEVPPTLLELRQVPGVGPRTIRLLYDALGIESLEDLRRAARTGLLATVPGLGARTVAGIVAGLEALDRRPRRWTLDRAEALVARLEAALSAVPGVTRVVAAGSFRRRAETVGDLDLLVETRHPEPLVGAFTHLDGVEEVIARGRQKASVRLRGGPQVDLLVMPPEAAGTYLVHFTGSKAHNVRLRAMARQRGWSLSEKGFVRLGPEEGEPAGPASGGSGGRRVTLPGEEEVYALLGLPLIAPELREDRGEVEAALAGRLPRLVEPDDLRGDLHSHSDWSDGVESVAAMAEAARRRGYAYLVLTDHTLGLGIARGLDPGRFAAQRALLDELNARFAAEEEAGRAPPQTPREGFRLLHGCELEIRADGRLDLPDDVLARFDIVVAALHQGRRQRRDQLTARVLAAIRSPHVDVLAHPAGRLLGEREDLDLEWEAIFLEAARTGTALEINGSPQRLDLAAERARRAVELGCLVSIDSDAHRASELDHVRYGVWQARRGWVEPTAVVNTRSRAELLAWAGGKPERVGGG